MKQVTVGPGKALICGSMAFDTIMVFGDRFQKHILADKLHMLNVSFLCRSCGASSAVARATSPTT